jgi:hypothetical protein
MNGSPSSIVMFGLGNGTFAGSPSLLVTRGLGIAAAGGLVGRWSNVITARAFTGPIIVSANTGPITVRASTEVGANG